MAAELAPWKQDGGGIDCQDAPKVRKKLSKKKYETFAAKLRAASYRKGGRDVKWLFETVDDDGSGAIDVIEFRTLIRRTLKLSQADFKEPEVMQLFRHLDVDGSGDVSIYELGRFLGLVDERGNGLGDGMEGIRQAADKAAEGRAAAASGAADPNRVQPGAMVWAQWKRGNAWHDAEVFGVNADGTYVVDYLTGDPMKKPKRWDVAPEKKVKAKPPEIADAAVEEDSFDAAAFPPFGGPNVDGDGDGGGGGGGNGNGLWGAGGPLAAATAKTLIVDEYAGFDPLMAALLVRGVGSDVSVACANGGPGGATPLQSSKLMLMARSELFRQAIAGAEIAGVLSPLSADGVVTVLDERLDPNAVKAILRCGAGGRVKVSAENINDLVRVANRLDFPAAESVLLTWLEKSLRLVDVPELFSLAEDMGAGLAGSNLAERVAAFALERFAEVAAAPWFGRLSTYGLEQIFLANGFMWDYESGDGPDAALVAAYLDAALAWVRVDVAVRTTSLERLLLPLQQLLPLLDGDHLMSTMGDPIVQAVPAAFGVVQQATMAKFQGEAEDVQAEEEYVASRRGWKPTHNG